MDWGTVELEPEVRGWLETLDTAQFGHVAFYMDLLAERGPLLGEPYTRQLDGKLRELRFYLDRRAMRITYWIAPGRRITMLTVFGKARMREDREVRRARRALARCEAQEQSTQPTRRKGSAMPEQAAWSDLRGRRMAEPGAEAAYEAARLAFDLGGAVRALREQRGWSQRQLACAAAMTQPAVARFEAGGTVPTLPVLQRLAHALDAQLVVHLARLPAA